MIRSVEEVDRRLKLISETVEADDVRVGRVRDLASHIFETPHVAPQDRALMLNTIIERGKSMPWMDRDFLASVAERSIRLHPTSAAYFQLGLLEGERGRQQASIDNYTKAIQHGDPNPSLCYLNIGNRYRALGQNESALTAYEKSIELSPKQAQAWFGAAQLYSNAGDIEQAMRCYQAYIGWFETIGADKLREHWRTQASIAKSYIEQYGTGGQQADLLAVRVLASCALFQAQGMHPSSRGLSWADAVHNVDEAVKAWEITKTPLAAIAAVTTALIALGIPPTSGPTRPSPEFREGLNRIVAGLTKIVNSTKP
ncbi:MAG: tetratricopeptide repeat protein [Candidatus Rokubacteria bacterium]|nr:tetratricopeptide repeat protein [Candidatus Rokubacteria bacterium]